MKPLLLSGIRSALVVAPHPDDEAIGAWGLIRTLRARGAAVRVVVVTDGAGSHPDSPTWPRARLIAARRRETLGVLRGVGVGKGAVTFLNLPDGGLATARKRLRGALGRVIARSRGCDLLVAPVRDDDHPDHRAIAAALPRVQGRRVDYLVWPNRQQRSARATHCLRLGTAAAAKRSAIRRYRTQAGAITDDPNGFAMSVREIARFSRPLELFREHRR